MRLLWVCNFKPAVLTDTVQIDTAGWLSGLLGGLQKIAGVELDVVYPYSYTTQWEWAGNVRTKGITSNKKLLSYDTLFEQQISALLKEQSYDCIHIWGTEYPHALATVMACHILNIGHKVLISIQGLCGICAQHYMAGLANIPTTFRDAVKRDSVKEQKRKFEIRGNFETKAISLCKHITGRTDWDEICTKQINPNRRYYYCNEVLREGFYKEQWHQEQCVPCRIFTSQAYYPIKGLHYLLEAMLLLRSQGKQVELYIAGGDITATSPIRTSGYGAYIKKFIQKNKMQEYVHFTGQLTQDGMIEQYKKANVFVLPSAIENSPNSLAEAMMLGTPCVAADVGGVKDMLLHKKEGYIYQSDAPYMLAGYIDKLLEDPALADAFSNSARQRALSDHDVQKNANKMMEIYRCISIGQEED